MMGRLRYFDYVVILAQKVNDQGQNDKVLVW